MTATTTSGVQEQTMLRKRSVFGGTRRICGADPRRRAKRRPCEYCRTGDLDRERGLLVCGALCAYKRFQWVWHRALPLRGFPHDDFFGGGHSAYHPCPSRMFSPTIVRCIHDPEWQEHALPFDHLGLLLPRPGQYIPGDSYVHDYRRHRNLQSSHRHRDRQHHSSHPSAERHSHVQSHHNLLTRLRIFDHAGGVAGPALAMGAGRDAAGDERGRRWRGTCAAPPRRRSGIFYER